MATEYRQTAGAVIRRSKDITFVQLTLAEGRTLNRSADFYKRVVDNLCTIASVSEGRMFSSVSLERGARTDPLETARRPSRPRSPRPSGSASGACLMLAILIGLRAPLGLRAADCVVIL